jgi:uncharacterized membrane protein YagU involved in acid resistance
MSAESKVTTDHKVIRKWVEEREGFPAARARSVLLLLLKSSSRNTGWSAVIPVRLGIGAAAGLLASGMMTLAMAVMRRGLPEDEKYPLPPREITLAMAARAGVEEHVADEPAKTLSTGAGHFSYGAFGGMLYQFIAHRIPLAALPKGLLFGFLFWAFGYLGWLPATGILAPATRHPLRRSLLMLSSHLIYGTVTALISSRFYGQKGNTL